MQPQGQREGGVRWATAAWVAEMHELTAVGGARGRQVRPRMDVHKGSLTRKTSQQKMTKLYFWKDFDETHRFNIAQIR